MVILQEALPNGTLGAGGVNYSPSLLPNPFFKKTTIVNLLINREMISRSVLHAIV